MSSSSIPDSTSTEALLKLMEAAKVEAAEESKDKPTMTEQQMRELVCKKVEKLTDKFDTIFGYKLVAVYALSCLFAHNNEGHKFNCENTDFETALCWGRDAGQLQLMLKNLSEIYCGPEDFFCDDV